VEVSPRYTNDHAAEGLSLKTLKFVLFFRYSYIIHTSLQFVYSPTLALNVQDIITPLLYGVGLH
jgi:hypothetical protein